MVRALGKKAVRLFVAASVLEICAVAALAQEDPPSRVARLNYVTGNVSMQPAGAGDWAPATVNRPFTIGDSLYTDQSAEAELHMDVAVMRMGPQTSFSFLNLNDSTVQIKLAEGDMYFRIRNFEPNQVFEVDTPNAAVTLLREGIYRFRVDPNGSMSFVVVRQGQAEITGGGQAFTLNPGNSAMVSGVDQLSYDVEVAPAPDEFDNWCAQRDAHEARLASARYLPPTVIGYEDLDDNGDWQVAGDYGPVWYPRAVVAGWAPYHNGHWAWIEPWGWTWVDDYSWGFAPFHYGRWAYISGRWGWCPGPIAVAGYRGPVIRPYYAPALVAWFGGSSWGVSVSVGGPSLGWVALGFGEVYTPPYVCSRGYFTNVNVHNTRIVNTVNITNVYNTVYVNHTVYNREFVNVRAPNAVMAMPQAAFATGRPVRQAGFAVRQADLVKVQASAVVIAPPVAPTRQALLPSAGRGPAAHPPMQVFDRKVVARNAPPPEPAPFAARQAYLQQHVGQPHNAVAMHQEVAKQQPAAAYVRQAPAARPVEVRPGQHVGNTFRAPAPNSQPAPNTRFTERTQGAPQPAPVQPRPAERTQTAPPAPPQQRFEQRNEPRPAERSQPAPPAPSQPRPAERTQTPPPPPPRDTPKPRDTKDTRDHSR
jgi:hypothetical protein